MPLSPLIRWLPILACLPHLLFAPLSGSTVLLHDHHDHELHAHVFLESDVDSESSAAHFLQQRHRHTHDEPMPPDRRNERAAEESTTLSYLVFPVDVASPRRSDLIIKDIRLQVYAGMIFTIAPIPGGHPPDANACAPNPCAGDSVTMILRSSNALLI